MKTDKDYGSICRKCAEKLKGISPEGHLCTMFIGVCPYCGEYKGLQGTNDYLWPDSKRDYPEKISPLLWD